MSFIGSSTKSLTLALNASIAVVSGGLLFAAAAYGQDVPRTPDGHPDLSGTYVGSPRAPTGEGAGPDFRGRGGDFFGFEEDNGLSRMSLQNWPLYKPEYWDLVQQNDYNGNWDDPNHNCYPAGVPGLGMPDQIINVAGQPAVILVYQAGFSGFMRRYSNFNEYRWVWTDGREHDPAIVALEGWNGDAVGHWEGDKLVIETIGFTDESWLSRSGWIHGFDMKVTETLWREGNVLHWDAVVDDPEYFQEPWHMDPMSQKLNPDPSAFIAPAPPCLDRDAPVLTSPTQSG